MPAIISVRISDADPADFWLEKRVTRVGSDGQCDLQVPSGDVAGHAATLQYRDGQYVIYNRSDAPLSISGQSLPPGDSSPWPQRGALRLARGVELFLLVDGDPAPCARPSDNEAIEHYQRIRREERIEEAQTSAELQAQQAAEEAATGKKPASTAQMVLAVFFFLIAGVILVGVLLFAFDEGEPAALPWNHPRRIASVLLANADQLPPILVSRIQESQQAIRLGDAGTARRQILRLQAELGGLQASGTRLTIKAGDRDVDYSAPLSGYINYYLGQFPK